MIGMEAKCVPSVGPDDRGRREILCAVFDSVPFLIRLLERSAERYAKEVVEYVHCKCLAMEANQKTMNSITSCSKPARKSSSRLFYSQKYVNMELTINEKRNIGDSLVYWKRADEVLRGYFS